MSARSISSSSFSSCMNFSRKRIVLYGITPERNVSYNRRNRRRPRATRRYSYAVDGGRLSSRLSHVAVENSPRCSAIPSSSSWPSASSMSARWVWDSQWWNFRSSISCSVLLVAVVTGSPLGDGWMVAVGSRVGESVCDVKGCFKNICEVWEMILRPQNTFNLGLRVGWLGVKRFCGRRTPSSIR